MKKQGIKQNVSIEEKIIVSYLSTRLNIKLNQSLENCLLFYLDENLS